MAGGVQAVHEGGEEREFVVHGVGEEVGVDEDLVGGLQGGVVGEEHGGGDLGAVMGWRVSLDADYFLSFSFFLGEAEFGVKWAQGRFLTFPGSTHCLSRLCSSFPSLSLRSRLRSS